jgi:D-alanyl-D-alanine carboxypeptidase
MIQHTLRTLTFICISIFLLTSCDNNNNQALSERSHTQANVEVESPTIDQPVEAVIPDQVITVPEDNDLDEAETEAEAEFIPPTIGATNGISLDNGPDVKIISEPESITVLVNKQYSLPKDYEPSELVYPDISFIFAEKLDKRKLRKEAAEAIVQLFAGAAEDKLTLLGVSAYRSNTTQKALFQRYVNRDGVEKARTYSAVPGHSEHETGLAIDVTGGDGKCAAMSCFSETEEAAWLAEHAADYGFVIRYPKGKEDVTGYMYEPWHLRYVGVHAAQEITAQSLTLEEYFTTVAVTDNE